MEVKNKNNFLLKFLFGFVFSLLLIGTIFASTEVFAITVDPNLGTTLDLGTADLKSTVINIIQWVLGLLGLVAVVMILYGGFLWMTARGNEDQIAKAKKVLQRAVVGLIIVLLSWAIVAFIVNRINDATGAYPAHCSNGVLDLAEGETGIDCGGPCPACSSSGSLPEDTFTWSETQTSIASGTDYAADVSLCSRLQSLFNHRIDGDTFAANFSTDNTGEIWIDGFDGTEDFTAHPMELVTSRNSVTLKHNDELFPQNTMMTLWIPEDVRDLGGEPLGAALAGALLGDNPHTGGTDDAYYWNFNTGISVDLIPPIITSTYPYSPPDARHPYRNVSMAPVMSVEFNEAIDITTIDDGSGNPLAGNFILEKLNNPSVCTGGGADDGDYCIANTDCDSNICTVDVDQVVDNTNFDVILTSEGFNIALDNGYIFDEFGWYRISISGIEDLCGNSMLGTHIFEFQTTDLQPGISGRYPTGPDACEGDRVYVGFNTTMYYNHVDINVTGGAQNYAATMYAEGLGLPGGIFSTPGTNGSIFRIIDTDDFNEFRGFELILPTNLLVGTTYTVNITTDKVLNSDGDLLIDTWNFTVKSAAECRCAPLITNISPDTGQEEQCVTISGYCFDGAGKATLTPPSIDFSDPDGDPVGVPGILGGSGSNFVTSVIPPDFEYGGDVSARPQIEITYDPVYNLGTASSSNFAIRYFIEEDVTSTGPCLWSLNPTSGPVNTTINLVGDRFLPATPPNQHINFQDGGASFIQNVFGIWNNVFIRSSADTTPPGSLLEGATYDTSVTTDGGDSNEIEYFVTVTPPGRSNVINAYPTCQAACVNADVGATITNNVVPASVVFDDGSNTGSVRLIQCADAVCNNLPPGNEIDISGSSYAVSGSELDLAIVHTNFAINTSYRVIITRDITNTSGGTIMTNYNFGGNPVYSWWFRTKDDPDECTVESVILSPQVHQMASVQTRGYEANAYGSPDSCNNGGQQLNSQVATWAWNSTDIAVATVAGSVTREELVSGEAAGTCQINVNITDLQGDAFNDNGNLTITDCETDEHCRNNCSVAGNQSVCVNSVCTPWIGNLDPDSGPRGTTTTIRGCYFGADQGQVLFGLDPGIFECLDSWTNNWIIAKTPDTLAAGSDYPVEVITDYDYTNYNSPPHAAGSNQANVLFSATNLCSGVCDVASDNAFESCLNNADCLPLGTGTCINGVPPASGVPGLCSVNPDTAKELEIVEYTGYNFIAARTLALFSQYLEGFIAEGGPGSVTGNTYHDVLVPEDFFTGPSKVLVDDCPSNSVDFYKYCDGDEDCASDCCKHNQCQIDAGACSTGAPGDLCRLSANAPFCQSGPLVSVTDVYRCIDPIGHISPNPPDGASYPADIPPGPAAVTDCRKCCYPGQTNGTLECNVLADTPCTGPERGLYCGCQYDPVNPAIGDAECGAQSCGKDTCCYDRIHVVSNEPADLAINVCRNALMKVAFSGAIDPYSVNSTSVIVIDISTGDILDQNYAILPSKIGFNMYPDDLFIAGHEIWVIVMGGVDGVLSAQGIAMADELGTEFNFDYDSDGIEDSYSYTFTVGDEICSIDHLQMTVATALDTFDPETRGGDLFTCATESCPGDNAALPGNQHVLFAEAMDDQNHPLAGAITYEFTEYSDPLDTLFLTDLDPQSKYITPNNENGRAIVRVKATSLEYGGEAIENVVVRNMLCENPWPSPSFGEDLPFEDNIYNFATWYCRDSGAQELERVDDIAMTNFGFTANNGDNELMRQYLIEWPGAPDLSDSIGIQIWENEGGFSSRDWFFNQFGPAAPEPQALDIDGYSAVRDGRTVYIAAWNIDGVPTVGESLYPNIYLISHSETASQEIIDIFNGLVTNFELNTNIDDLEEKFAMQRDFHRVSDLNIIYNGLLKYYQENNTYPLLPGGTYIQKMSTSAWPSWDETLGSVLGITMPKDPFNTFDACPYTDTTTCWDDINKEYQCPDTGDGSFIYQYFASDEGNMDLFGHLEMLSVTATSPEQFSWGPAATAERCGSISNATCPCFNYVKNTTGVPTDRIGPVINSIENIDTSDTAVPGGTLTVSGTQTIDVDVIDVDSTINRIEFWVDGGIRNTDTDGTGDEWTWVMNSTQFMDGDHNLEIRAYDEYNNSRFANFYLLVDNTGVVNDPPFLDFLNVGDGDVISGIFDINFYVSDDGGPFTELFFSIENANGESDFSTMPVGLATTNPRDWTIVWDTKQDNWPIVPAPDGVIDFPNGVYTLYLRVIDSDGLETELRVTVIVQNYDVTPPAITISDIDGSCSVGTCDDGTACIRYDACMDGSICGSFPVCHQNLPCATGSCLREGVVPLQFIVTDDSAVENVSVYIDGSSVGSAVKIADDTYQLNWDTLLFPNGIRAVEVKAIDDYGNESSQNIDILIDNAANDIEPPSLSFIQPPTPLWGTAVAGQVNVAAEAEDNRGIESVHFFVDYRTRAIDLTLPWEFSFDSNPLSDGWHSLQAIAFDSAGNYSEAEEIVFNVRGNGGPAIIDATVYPTTGGAGTFRCFNAGVSDDDGVVSVEAIIQDEDESNVAIVNMSLTSGDEFDGIYDGSWEVPVGLPSSIFYVDIMTEDAIGNISMLNNISGVEGVCGGGGPAPVPVITSSLARSDTAGTSYSYTITANNSPIEFFAANLPTWLTLNSSTGLISGNSPANANISSPYNIILSARNASGVGPTSTLVLTINAASGGGCACFRATPACTATSSGACNAIPHCDWRTTYPVGCYYDGFCTGASEAKCMSTTSCYCD